VEFWPVLDSDFSETLIRFRTVSVGEAYAEICIHHTVERQSPQSMQSSGGSMVSKSVGKVDTENAKNGGADGEEVFSFGDVFFDAVSSPLNPDAVF
jgi:hypothetical protein